MRLRLTFALLLGLLLAATPASAQFLGPGNTLAVSSTSVLVANTTTATALYDITVPAGAVQSARLHTKLIGTLQTNSSGSNTMTLATAWGGTSLTLVNAIAPATSIAASTPFEIDVYVAPHGANTSTTQTFTSVTTQAFVWGCLNFQTTGGLVSRICGQSLMTGASVSTDQARNLSITWTWGLASVNNSITSQHGMTTVGG